MSKIDDFQFFDQELIEFKNQVRDLINFGKYQKQVISSLPSWVGAQGEEVLYIASSGGTTNYFYKGTAWISSWSVTA